MQQLFCHIALTGSIKKFANGNFVSLHKISSGVLCKNLCRLTRLHDLLYIYIIEIYYRDIQGINIIYNRNKQSLSNRVNHVNNVNTPFAGISKRVITRYETCKLTRFEQQKNKSPTGDTIIPHSYKLLTFNKFSIEKTA